MASSNPFQKFQNPYQNASRYVINDDDDDDDNGDGQSDDGLGGEWLETRNPSKMTDKERKAIIEQARLQRRRPLASGPGGSGIAVNNSHKGNSNPGIIAKATNQEEAELFDLTTPERPMKRGPVILDSFLEDTPVDSSPHRNPQLKVLHPDFNFITHLADDQTGILHLLLCLWIDCYRNSEWVVSHLLYRLPNVFRGKWSWRAKKRIPLKTTNQATRKMKMDKAVKVRVNF
jgi:hypothetical protein